MTLARMRRAPARHVALALALLAAGCGGFHSDEEIAATGGEGAAVAPRSSTGSGAPNAPAGGGAAAGPSATDPTVPTEPAPAAVGGEPAGAADGPGAPGGAIGTPGESGPIVVGSVGSFSGPAGAATRDIPRGFQAWVAAVNGAGGLFGRQVQVIVQDDGGDPARAAAIVRDLVENRGVVAIVAYAGALTERGIRDYVTKKGVPVIGTDCSNREYWNHDIYFPQCPKTRDQLIGMVANGVRLTGERRFGFVACTEADFCRETSEVMRSGGAKKAGAELVYSADVSIVQVDFTAQCRAAKDAGVTLMSVGLDPSGIARWARSCDRQGFRPQYALLHLNATPETLGLPGFATAALAMSVFPFEGVDGGPYGEFASAIKTYVGSEPSPGLAFGWVAGKLFESIATRAASATKSISPRTLLDTGNTVENETLGGLTVPLTFKAKIPQHAPCWFAMRGDGAGHWTAPSGANPQCP